MKLNKLIFALIFIFSSQIFVTAQTFDLAVFLETTQAVARKTAYQSWVEHTSDFKLTETTAKGEKTSYTYESICSRKNCVSIPVAKNDKRYSDKNIEKSRKQAAKIFLKSENRADSVSYGEKENLVGYGISIYDWFSPSLYLKVCKNQLAEKSIINGRPTVKIKVSECNVEKFTQTNNKSNLQFMTKTDGLIWIDEQDKAIIKAEIYARKEFPNLSKTDQPLVIIEAEKNGENYWFWKSIKVKALDNKAVFPKYKNNMEYEFFNYRLSNVEVKSADVNEK